MRKSKNKKTENKLRWLNASKTKKKEKEDELKEKEERDEKFQAWVDLPQEEWTDARKLKNGIELGEKKDEGN